MTVTPNVLNAISTSNTARMADPAQARHAKLVDAAQKFEGMMLEEMLKPMQKSRDGAFGDASASDGDDSLDTMTSFGTEAVANAIAKSGGLGIAKQVLQKVTDLDTRTKRDFGSTKV